MKLWRELGDYGIAKILDSCSPQLHTFKRFNRTQIKTWDLISSSFPSAHTFLQTLIRRWSWTTSWRSHLSLSSNQPSSVTGQQRKISHTMSLSNTTSYCCQNLKLPTDPSQELLWTDLVIVFNETRFQAAGGKHTLVILRGTGAALETGSVSLCGLKTSQPQFPSTTYFYFISESAGRPGPSACSTPSTHSHRLKPGTGPRRRRAETLYLDRRTNTPGQGNTHRQKRQEHSKTFGLKSAWFEW